MLRRASLAFAAGSLGGLAAGVTLWLLGSLGVSGALGVALAPPLAPDWLYPRIVTGGLWGFLFLLPLVRRSWWLRGLILSLAPSLVQLLIVFPFKSGHGPLGVGLGLLTPLVVLLANAAWGLTAAAWLRGLGVR